MPARSAAAAVFCYVTFALLVVAPQADARFRCDCSMNGFRYQVVSISCATNSTIGDVDKAVHCETGRRRTVVPGYVVNPGEKKSGYSALYRLYRTGRNWRDASESCRRDGAHLAVPETQEEKNFLADQLKEQGGGRTTNALVGVRKAAGSNQRFDSVTGQDVSTVLSWNWPAGTPRDVPGQLCVELFHIGQDFGYGFRTRDCDQPAAYFCERSFNPPVNRKYTFVEGLGFYMPSSQLLTYIDAELQCFKTQGHIAVPVKQQHADMLMKAFDMYEVEEQIYVGIDDRRKLGVFETYDGVRIGALDFLNWAPGALETRGVNDRCVTFTTSGNYQLVNCETPLPSVCAFAGL